MSIEIYNKAKIVHKDGVFYYFLKHHSKNDCICAGQVITDDNFNDKFISRNSRAGSWSIKAHGTEQDKDSDKIAKTDWNCPTSRVYGQIRFGNKKNIALYYAKNKHNWIDFGTLTEMQKKNVSSIIDWYNKNPEYQCNLSDIKPENYMRAVHTYCDDKQIKLEEHNPIHYEGHYYWNHDNL